jgi:hypothetical protein
MYTLYTQVYSIQLFQACVERDPKIVSAVTELQLMLNLNLLTL